MIAARHAATALAAAALASCVAIAPAPPTTPPCALTVDGMLDDPIWTAAQRVELRDATLLLLQAPEHLCIGVDARSAGLRYVDIFIQDGRHIRHNLHASMQVGERTLPDGRWTDENPPTAWGQTSGWTANVSPRQPEATDDTPVADLFAPFDGYEFVIDRARMPRPWRIRVEVRDFEGEARDIVWPAESRRTDVLSWALLQ